MSDVTIIIEEEGVVLVSGRSKKSRPVWFADGVTCHMVGAMTDKNYDQLRNLFFQHCLSINIHPYAVHELNDMKPKPRPIETKTRRMF